MFSNLEGFVERYQHAWNKIMWHVPDKLRHGRCLDIGCGIGNGVAAAVAHGASLAVGIDRSFGEFAHEFRVEDFPDLCRAVGTTSAPTVLLEGDIFQMRFPSADFDYALMIDSAEHVPDPGAFFRWAHDALREGGCFVVDTCPLYFSPVGSHLWTWLREENDPWAHLKPDFEQRCRDLGVDDWSLQRYRELNRATHDDLRLALAAAGFEITFEHRSTATPERETLLERHGAGIDFAMVRREWLFEDWILLVGRRL